MSTLSQSKAISYSNGHAPVARRFPFFSKPNAQMPSLYETAQNLAARGAQAALECGNDPVKIREAGQFYANAVKTVQDDIHGLSTLDEFFARRDAPIWALQAVELLKRAGKKFEDYHQWESASKSYIKAAHTLSRMHLDPDQRLDLCFHAIKCLWMETSKVGGRNKERILQTLTGIAAHIEELRAAAYGQKMNDVIDDVRTPYNLQVKGWAMKQAECYVRAVNYYQEDLKKDPTHPNAPQWQQDLTEAVCNVGSMQFELGKQEMARDLAESGIKALLAYSKHIDGQFTPEEKKSIVKSVDANFRRLIQVLGSTQPEFQN